MTLNSNNYRNIPSKSFWKRPEGVVGAIFLIALMAGVGYLLLTFSSVLISLAQNTLYLGILITLLAALTYVVFDPKMRNLVAYAYKGAMRWITSWFIQLDPMSILKSYVEELRVNLRKMSKQIGALRGQMRRLDRTIQKNKEDIERSMKLANQAKIEGKQSQLVLELRRVGRLKESNEKLIVLFKKMEVLQKVLKKMYDNSEILLEDIQDQVRLKEQERRAIRASHSAMKSAMNIISGDKDQRYMFDQAMEALAEDVALKVGEMERFMDVSTTFMDSIDLQKGIFEDEGMQLLQEWEKKSESLLLNKPNQLFDLNHKPEEKEAIKRRMDEDNHYNSLFGD